MHLLLTSFCIKTNLRENRFFAARLAIGGKKATHNVKIYTEKRTIVGRSLTLGQTFGLVFLWLLVVLGFLVILGFLGFLGFLGILVILGLLVFLVILAKIVYQKAQPSFHLFTFSPFHL